MFIVFSLFVKYNPVTIWAEMTKPVLLPLFITYSYWRPLNIVAYRVSVSRFHNTLIQCRINKVTTENWIPFPIWFSFYKVFRIRFQSVWKMDNYNFIWIKVYCSLKYRIRRSVAWHAINLLLIHNICNETLIHNSMW